MRLPSMERLRAGLHSKALQSCLAATPSTVPGMSEMVLERGGQNEAQVCSRGGTDQLLSSAVQCNVHPAPAEHYISYPGPAHIGSALCAATGGVELSIFPSILSNSFILFSNHAHLSTPNSFFIQFYLVWDQEHVYIYRAVFSRPLHHKPIQIYVYHSSKLAQYMAMNVNAGSEGQVTQVPCRKGSQKQCGLVQCAACKKLFRSKGGVPVHKCTPIAVLPSYAPPAKCSRK